MFCSDVISDKIEIVENYLFKCVWYKIEEYDLIYKMCNWKPKFIFEKIGMFILKFDIIKLELLFFGRSFLHFCAFLAPAQQRDQHAGGNH